MTVPVCSRALLSGVEGAPHHVWGYDFVRESTHDGQLFRILNVIDEYTRECLAIRVARP